MAARHQALEHELASAKQRLGEIRAEICRLNGEPRTFTNNSRIDAEHGRRVATADLAGGFPSAIVEDVADDDPSPASTISRAVSAPIPRAAPEIRAILPSRR